MGGRMLRNAQFWARGYFVSTVDLDEDVVRKYIRDQEKNDSSRDQFDLDW
nr:transposase [Endozoicomonas acroporae]